MWKHVHIFEQMSDSFGRSVVNSIARYAHQHGHWAFQRTPLDGLRLTIKTSTVDGLIVRGGTPYWFQKYMRRHRLPRVCFGLYVAPQNLPGVMVDNVATGRLAAEHLLERGYKRFGFLQLELTPRQTLRRQGFLGTVKTAGGSCRCLLLRPAPRARWSLRARVEEVAHWLAALRLPVGIMVGQDACGFLVAQACQQLHFRIPEDVALIGADNDEVDCHLIWPPLSSVQPDTQRIGLETAALLDRLMNGQPAPREPIAIPPLRVVTRASTDMLAIEDQQIARALRFMREHVAEPITVKHVLHAVPMARRSFERRFQQWVGRTPATEIQRLRIDRAKSLLLESDLKMEGVATACGFAHRQELWTAFRKQTGMSPQDYRRHHRQT